MLLVSAFGCAAFTGLAGGFLSLKEALDQYVREGGYPDALVTTDVTERRRMDALKAVPGVAEVNARLIGNLVLVNWDGRYLSIRAMSFDENEFQQFYFWDRADQGAYDPIYLEYNFAKTAGINAGDTVRIKVGGEFREYAVTGIVSRPETLSIEPSDDVSITSNDFGYVYAPRSLLEKEVNWEHRDALTEWEEKNGELAEAESSAQQEYENVLAELDSAEAELNAKTEEFAQTQQELTAQRAELEELKEELLGQRAELEEKKTEAENSQKELESNKTEAREKEAELNRGQAELDQKQAELNDAEQTLKAQRNALLKMQKQALGRGIALMETRDALLSGREELEQARTEALDQRSDLYYARSELSKKIDQLKEQRSLLQSAKALLSGSITLPDQAIQSALKEAENLISNLEKTLDRLEDARSSLRSMAAEIASAEIEGIDTAELRARWQKVADQVAAMGFSADGIDSAMQQVRSSLAEARARKDELSAQLSTEAGRERLQAQLKSMLGSYAPSGTITQATLDAALSQVNSYYSQANSGMDRINEGLRLIREGLQLANEKELEIDGGLMQTQAGREQLNGALRQIADGFWHLDQANAQIAEGRAEIGRYQAQIDEGRQALQEGYAQLADYQAQLDEGFEQLKTGQEEIASALEEIEGGKKQIDDAVAEARQQLADGEAQLADKRAEAESGWIEALAEFADLKEELRRAYEELSEWEGYQVFCNQFLLRFSPEASPDAVLEDVKKALSDAGVEVKSTVLYESSPINRRINNNLIPIETMANFIPMIFFAIAMIVVYLFMSLMIRQCRREIGILRALGFTRFRVVSLFCGAGLLVSLGAVAFGLAVSLAVRGYFVHYFFDILFPLPVHVLVFSWPKFLLSAVLTLAAVETSTVVSALSISGIQPSEAMTRVKPSAVKIPRFVRWALRGASPFLKFSVISLLRNRLRFLFSAVCIAGSVMLIFTSRSLISSTNEILDRTFTRSIHYDCQIFISEKEADDLQRAVATLPYVSDVERMDYYTASFFLNGHSESAKVVVVQENTRLLSVEDQKRNVLPITGDGVVLEKHLAERLGASIGDTVEVNGAPLRVSAVSEQCAARFQYMDDTQAYALGDCTLRSLICHVPVQYESEFMGFLVEQDGYLYAVFTHSAYSSCLFLLEGANLACWMLIVIAMIIGLVIVVNTSQTNLLEQKRELCVLRTLGFQHGELSLYWFAQSLLHFLCSCVLGFPAGIAMAKRAIQNMEMELYTYTFVNNPWDYAVTAGLVFAYIVFSHFLSMRSLRRWDIVECVKDKE